MNLHLRRWALLLIPSFFAVILASSRPHAICGQAGPTPLPPTKISYGQSMKGTLGYDPGSPCGSGSYWATIEFSGTSGDYITLLIQFEPSYSVEHLGLPIVELHAPDGGVLAFGQQGADPSHPSAVAIPEQQLPTTGIYSIDMWQLTNVQGQTSPSTLKFPFTITLLKVSAPTATVAPPTNTPTPTNSPAPTLTSWPSIGHSFTVGQSPSYALWHANQLYVANDDGTVSVLDAHGKTLNTVKVGGVPYGMAWVATRGCLLIYRAERSSSTLYSATGLLPGRGDGSYGFLFAIAPGTM